jgi:hypothetical protein
MSQPDYDSSRSDEYDLEVFAIDLDEEMLSHLAFPESIKIFRDERLNPAVIEDEGIQEIYEWQMTHLREYGEPATPSVLADEWDLNLLPPETKPRYLIERLRERYMTNHARDHMEKVSAAYKESPRSVPNVMIEVGRELAQIVNPVGEQYSNNDYDKVMEVYDHRALQGPGASLGFKHLDDYFYGMRGVVMYMGSPKSMKTWIGANALLSNILQGRKVCAYPLEIPAQEMTERLYALAANVPPWKFLKGSLNREDRKILKEAIKVLDESGLYRIEKPPAGQRSIDHLVEHARDFEADVILVDQLQYVEFSKGRQLGSGTPHDYWQVLNKARDMSDDGPIAFVHQFNRETRFMDEMPSMQYAKGAAACEEVASLILAMWANKDMRASNLMHVGAIASRHYVEQTWEIALDLTRGCKFECLGIVENDE